MDQSEPDLSEFYLPAEWERHEGTWLQWPHDQAMPGNQLKNERTWLRMVAALQPHEKVHLIACDERQRDHIERQLKYFAIGLENVDFQVIPTDDMWARDNGPIFVVNAQGESAITNWQFNGWGNRFAHDLDNQVPAIIGARIGVPVFNPPLVLEGGAVEVNGQGTFLATRTSILNANRNPGRSQAEVEGILRDYLGVTHFIWLSGAEVEECGRWGDDTDSHIDICARFTAGSTVLYNWTDDESDPRHALFARHVEELKRATNESGQPLTLVPLPAPRVYRISAPRPRHNTHLTDAAYSNYLIANGVVLVPVFGHEYDERAKKIIGAQFPDREIVGIDCVSLTEGGGAIHCVTQQQPACVNGSTRAL